MQNEDSEPITDRATTADSAAEKAGEGGTCAALLSWICCCLAISGVGYWAIVLPVREKTVQKELSASIVLSSANLGIWISSGLLPAFLSQLPPPPLRLLTRAREHS